MKKNVVLFSNLGLNEDNQEVFDLLIEDLSLSIYDTECVLFGNVAMWYGRREIVPERFKCVVDAIYKAIFHADFIEVKQVNGHLEVTAMHHDGNNYFQIHLLNDKGLLTENGDLRNRRYHRAVKDYFV